MPSNFKRDIRNKMYDTSEYREVVQLDVDNPIEERRTESGARRLRLNNRERQIARERKTIAKAVALLTSGMSVPEIAQELKVPQSSLVEAITGDQYPDFRNAAIDRAIDMFLDIENDHPRTEIMNTLGLSHETFRNLTNSRDFEERYNHHFLELRTDPVVTAVQHKLVDTLLPKAFRVLQEILDDTNAPATARIRAALEVLNKAGIKDMQPQQSDRHELVKFLGEKGITINNLTVNLPAEYQQAIEKWNVVEGDYREADTPDEPDELPSGEEDTPPGDNSLS